MLLLALLFIVLQQDAFNAAKFCIDRIQKPFDSSDIEYIWGECQGIFFIIHSKADYFFEQSGWLIMALRE
jgi:hypothetical protein